MKSLELHTIMTRYCVELGAAPIPDKLRCHLFPDISLVHRGADHASGLTFRGQDDWRVEDVWCFGMGCL